MTPISIDESTLTTAVRRALGSSTADLTSWQLEPVPYSVINRITAGLYRLTGSAADHSSAHRWSVFLKILQHTAPDSVSAFNSSDDPAHWNYWRREALVYASDLLDHLPATIGVPRCYAVTTPTPNTQWLWLIETIVAQRAAVILHALALADEARALLPFIRSFYAN